MNWHWLIPIWGMKEAIKDDADNYANDYMEHKMLPILIYQLIIVTLPLSYFVSLL